MNDLFLHHPAGYHHPAEVMRMEERNAVLVNLPTSVRGFVCLGKDGEPVIIVNARLTRAQNRITFDHERNHIANGDMGNTEFHEYGDD